VRVTLLPIILRKTIVLVGIVIPPRFPPFLHLSQLFPLSFRRRFSQVRHFLEESPAVFPSHSVVVRVPTRPLAVVIAAAAATARRRVAHHAAHFSGAHRTTVVRGDKTRWETTVRVNSFLNSGRKNPDCVVQFACNLFTPCLSTAGTAAVEQDVCLLRYDPG